MANAGKAQQLSNEKKFTTARSYKDQKRAHVKHIRQQAKDITKEHPLCNRYGGGWND